MVFSGGTEHIEHTYSPGDPLGWLTIIGAGQPNEGSLCTGEAESLRLDASAAQSEEHSHRGAQRSDLMDLKLNLVLNQNQPSLKDSIQTPLPI